MDNLALLGPLFWIGWSLSRIADNYCKKDKAP